MGVAKGKSKQRNGEEVHGRDYEKGGANRSGENEAEV
jgi:hypothetical protein